MRYLGVVKFTETESRMAVAGAGGGTNGVLVFSGDLV